MTDIASKHQLQRLGVLMRIQDLDTQKAALALRSQVQALSKAAEHLQGCEARALAVSVWKQPADRGMLRLDTYSAALHLEEMMIVQHAGAARDVAVCEGQLKYARAAHRSALSNERSGAERYRRQSGELIRQQEHLESDICTELWLGGRFINGN